MNWAHNALAKVLPVFPKSFIRLFARRYIAGETLLEAVEESKRLNAAHMKITMDVLGENITYLHEAIAAKQSCLAVLDAIHEYNLDGNISIKLTQLGLKLDRSVCEENVSEILERANSYQNFVRIDMEDSSCTDDTLDICLKMHKKHRNVGTVIQAYLKRSEQDVKFMAKTGINLRICKGIYDEPASIAFKDKEEIRSNYVQLVQVMLDAGVYVGIATHDSQLIERVSQELEKRHTSTNCYEFQMLLGVRETLQQQIVSAGHPLRVYVPFGKHWYPYSLRRLKENPQIAGYILRNIFAKN